MKTNIIMIFKWILAIAFFAGLIFLLYSWTLQTIFGIVAFVKIIENWKVITIIVLSSLLAGAGGFAMIWLIHLVCTGQFLIDLHTLWGIGFLFTSIYALGLIIEEDQRRPYIWFWKQITTFRKCIIA